MSRPPRSIAFDTVRNGIEKAFGFGIERIAMLKHGIDHIGLFFENDRRFLEQFPARK